MPPTTPTLIIVPEPLREPDGRPVLAVDLEPKSEVHDSVLFALGQALLSAFASPDQLRSVLLG